jgi:hypothetical protein
MRLIIGLCPDFRISSLRSKLSSFCWSEELVNCLTTYLSENDLGEEDPVLLVNYLPQLTAQVRFC